MTDKLITDLVDYQAVKFGQFILKSGLISPIYIDIRVSVSHPQFLQDIAEAVNKTIETFDIKYDFLCGVPYTALPIATCMSTKTRKPMVMRRKENKNYGTKQLVEGVYHQGQTVLVIEDICTTGISVWETVQVLMDVGLQVTDVVVFIDREQGGFEFLKDKGLRLHSVFRITDILDCLASRGKISSELAHESKTFIENARTSIVPSLISAEKGSFEYRSKSLMAHPVARKLFSICEEKKTNLCVAADVTTSKELIDLAEKVGPYICMLKTHIDVVEDFSQETVKKLKEIANREKFLLFEDRKFADIGHTVQLQYTRGVHRIMEWADIVTIHGLPGVTQITALKSVDFGRLKDERACVLVAELSAQGSLVEAAYTKACIKMAEDHSDFVIGFISQSRLTGSSSFIHMTPGVQMNLESGEMPTDDGLGQRYVTPLAAVTERYADVIIVGRGIIQAPDPVEAAKQYRNAGFHAYTNLVKNVD